MKTVGLAVLVLSAVAAFGTDLKGKVEADVFGGGVRTDDISLGGGIRIYAKNKKWGVTPEVRWIRIFADGDDTNVVSYTGGIFFQWGK